MQFQLGRVGLFHLLLSIALPKTEGNHKGVWLWDKKKTPRPMTWVERRHSNSQHEMVMRVLETARRAGAPPPTTTTTTLATTPPWKGEYSATQQWLICPQAGYGKSVYFKDCSSGFCELGCTGERAKFVSVIIFEWLSDSWALERVRY